MKHVTHIKVGLNFSGTILPVGQLAINEGIIYFQYDEELIASGLNISPFHLPLKTELTNFDVNLFEGLPGVFNDSLPDGWGRLLLDRAALSKGINRGEITPLDRLASVGQHGMGALVYEPDHSDSQEGEISLDDLNDKMQQVLKGKADDVINELQGLNGGSGGARPKAMIGLNKNRDHIIHGVSDLPSDYEHWMVKFSSTEDGQDAGVIEYIYALMAKKAGIHMPEVHLFPSGKGAGYFAVQRFDRFGKNRYHMHSACGLLHSDFRTPYLDYENLLTLTMQLTKDIQEVKEMYRLAVFNALAHNQDDHSKNFSFLMAEDGSWRLSPAYDLTFCHRLNGEQSTTIMGQGKHIEVPHLLELGKTAGLDEAYTKSTIDEVKSNLNQWSHLAKNYGVSKQKEKEIGEALA